MGARAHAGRLRADRRRQRLDATARARSPRGSAPAWSREPRRGFGAACWAGLARGAGRRRLLHGLRRVVRPARAAAGRRPGRARARADLVLGARAPRPAPGRCTRARPTPLLAAELRRRTGVPLRDLGPMRAARRERAARRSGIARPPLRLAAGDGAARGGRRAGGSTRSASRYHPRAGRSKVTGTVRGTVRAVRDMAAVLA